MTPSEIIRTIKLAINNVPGVRALFLSGSYGNGLADAYSDIDFILVNDDGATAEIADIWRKAVSQTGEIILWWDRTTAPVLINAITKDWTRTDVLLLKPDQMRAYSQAQLRPVFDHDGIFETLARTLPKTAPNRSKFLRQIENFIRVLGLLHLAVGRQEYLNGVLGIYHLRNHLVELLVDETDAPNRGGILHLNRLITQEQKALLTALPPPVPEREAMISAHLAYAKAYLPRARDRARKLGIDWPEQFETATWHQLHKTLDIARPYAPE